MTDQELEQEGMNLRLIVLLFYKKLWILLTVTVLSGLLAGGAYFASHTLWAPARQYQALSKYYISFANDKAKDYYNAYTWNEYMQSDLILNRTMDILGEKESRDFVKNAVHAAIESDVRVLTTTVTTNDKELTERIAKATQQSLVQFADELPEFHSIRIIKEAEVSLVKSGEDTIRAVILGAGGGFLLSFFVILFCLVLDTSVYLPEEFEKRFPYLVFGVLTKNEKEENRQELYSNLCYFCGEVQKLFLMPASANDLTEAEAICRKLNEEGKTRIKIEAVDSCLYNSGIYEKLRARGSVILAVKYKNRDHALIQKTIDQLKKQNCNLAGALIYAADDRLYHMYYWGFKRKK